MNPFSVRGKVVIITGGSGFLGGQYSTAFHERGAEVIDWSRKKNVDITKPELVKEAANEALRKFGRLDILINNAALNPVLGNKDQYLPFEQYSLELWKRELEIGITGMMICTQAVAPAMMKQGSGSIINIGSQYGLVSPDNRLYNEGMFKSIAYSTFKGAVPNFTRAWAGYLGPHGVRVNCLALGGVLHGNDPEFVKKYSQRTMLGRMANKNDFDGAIIFLASAASSYVTGACLSIDGGWTAW